MDWIVTYDAASSFWNLSAKFTLACLLVWVPRASAQQVTGRFYPEKSEYLAGEPIIVDFEVVNNSLDPFEIGESDCPWLNRHQFEVDNASPQKQFVLFGCIGGTAGSCLSGSRRIPPGGTFRHRFLLEGDFELDLPGTYHVHARRRQQVKRIGAGEPNVDLNVDSKFDVVLRAPTGTDLREAYEPLFDNLRGPNLTARNLAARAVTQNPPLFAEPFVLALADDPMLSSLSVKGLKRLATPAARRKLLQMSSTASPESTRQQAIPALGEIGNPEDCQTMLNIAADSQGYTQVQAYVAAGAICKEQGVQVLEDLTPSADPTMLGGLAIALKNTSSRAAIPTLISLLKNSDEFVRRDAEDALEMLTHVKSQYGIGDENQAIQAYNEWSLWWSEHGRTAPLYNPYQCVIAKLLS